MSNDDSQKPSVEITTAAESVAETLAPLEQEYVEENEAQIEIVSEPIDEAAVELLIIDVANSLRESRGDLDQAIGSVLEIEDVQEAINKAQRVEKFEDEAQLEETVVEFDIQAFFASRGLGSQRVKRTQQKLPPLIAAQDLKEEFAMPTLTNIGIDGIIRLQFSS